MRVLTLVLLLSTAMIRPATAAEWHITPAGKAGNTGTQEAPWDIASALGGGQQVAPGDTLWLHGGTYKHPYVNGGMGYAVRLAGTAEAPVRVQACAGERVTIDGGLTILAPSNYVWIMGLEILVSEPRQEQPYAVDPAYSNLHRPWGGLNIYAGTGCKYVNLVIHDNCQGVSFWTPATDSELYGCLIYDNGWAGTDRGHGHAIYTQNKDGVKTIADNIMTGGFGYSLHAYGSSRADVDNYLVTGNICYHSNTFLIGGGKASHNIRAIGNILYHTTMQIGYSAPENDNCEIRENLIVNGHLIIKNYKTVTNAGNTLLAADAPRPAEATIILRKNTYDPRRAHLVIGNWARTPSVAVDFSGFLHPGDTYRLLNPRDVYGKPVLTGTYTGQAIAVPMTDEFGAWVVIGT